MNRWTLLALLTFVVVFTGSYLLLTNQNPDLDRDAVDPELLETIDDDKVVTEALEHPDVSKDAAVPGDAAAAVVEGGLDAALPGAPVTRAAPAKPADPPIDTVDTSQSVDELLDGKTADLDDDKESDLSPDASMHVSSDASDKDSSHGSELKAPGSEQEQPKQP